MSELIYTKCDSCPLVVNVSPEVAREVYGFYEDDYGSHFCKTCVDNAEDLEASTASPEEMGQLVDALEEETKKLTTAKRGGVKKKRLD